MGGADLPTYEFKDAQTGEMIEMFSPMSEAVPIGEKVESGGRWLIRVPSSPEQSNVPNVYFTSHQMPQNYKFAKTFDSFGAPVFSSKRALDECLARANHAGEGWGWNQ